MFDSARRACEMFACIAVASVIGLYAHADQGRENTDRLRFAEVVKEFPAEPKNLRKWDAPVVADLDQDGYVDLLLNDHGFGVRVCWNNKGRYAKPIDLVMGDLHGITVGDYDLDGNQEVVISRGGGSGENARNALVYRVDRQRQFTRLPDFQPPLEPMRGRTVKLFDGDNDGDLDLINFGFPSAERRGESENYVYRNDGNGRLSLAGVVPPSIADGQKTLLTDFNSDGVVDLLLYGQGKVRAFQGLGGLVYDEVSDAVLPSPLTDVTSIVEFDFDNDGDFDLFMTRGEEYEIGETFFDAKTSTWGFYTKRGRFQFEDLPVGDILKIENLQTQWPHKKLFLGESAYEYEFPGETHSGRDVRLVNSDALGWPDEINEKGAYIGYVGNTDWRLAGDIWSPASGIVHGVKSYPPYEHPPGLPDVLLENRNGRYFDITKQANLYREEHTTGAATADFDNDGLQDLLVVRRGDLIHANESLIYLNRGTAGFQQVQGHGVVSPELGAIGLGAEALDFDSDGRVDVLVGNERGKWRLFRNSMQDSANHHYIAVQVGCSESGEVTSLGARVRVQYGDMQQIKSVGSSSAAYSRSNNPCLHFGLGAWEDRVDVEVTWSNGEVESRTTSQTNTTLRIGYDIPSD